MSSSSYTRLRVPQWIATAANAALLLLLPHWQPGLSGLNAIRIELAVGHEHERPYLQSQ